MTTRREQKNAAIILVISGISGCDFNFLMLGQAKKITGYRNTSTTVRMLNVVITATTSQPAI